MGFKPVEKRFSDIILSRIKSVTLIKIVSILFQLSTFKTLPAKRGPCIQASLPCSPTISRPVCTSEIVLFKLFNYKKHFTLYFHKRSFSFPSLSDDQKSLSFVSLLLFQILMSTTPFISQQWRKA